MSVVTVQLGQCGNQVGQELFEVICSDGQDRQRTAYRTASEERFFHRSACGADLVARAVLIDMEPKVIDNIRSKAAKCSRWRYGDSSHFSQKQGSGNNWANGYCVHGPRHREEVEELVRQEVERCDRLAGLVAMMSVAGGTGSGVGTYVTQCLRDTYPNSFIINHLTWPYGTGEVIVQNYNSVLTLAHLYQLSDGILVHENDTVHKICSQLLNIKHISFGDVNRVIAQQLGSVLQPSLTGASLGEYCRNPLGELVSTLACHPEYKLLSVCSIPQMPNSSIAYSTFSWPALLKHLRQMLISNTKMEEAGFEDPALYTSWLSPEAAFDVWKSPLHFNKYEKSATLVSNSQALLRSLDNMVGKAWNMFASRAYVHHYIKFGISEEDFLENFTSLEQVISSYSQLH
ncbi:tubulin delta chain isoform X3 [Thalassophryne amazonica]|uniref:tubulin delta chain isoform X3 n=1 Tax=Thalassophryne amazonica TaxID=390379 RepID=UPI00147102A6|nr:tubulin delta chain isoform X3 [Thalassophryne amazonica]